MWRCSLVSLERYLVLIMFIVEKAASQLYVEPNMVKMCRATFLRPGKAVSGTIWSQNVEESLLTNCSFRATSAWRSTNCIWRGPAFTHLKCCVTSFENSMTSVMRNGFWMNMVSCCPNLKLSKRLLKFTISLSIKSTKEDTSLCPWTWSCTAGKCAQSPCRSSLKFPLKGADSCHQFTNWIVLAL